MVKVSKLRSLDIYTNTGHYVGRVEDVVLNIRLGTISKLQVRAIEHERKPAGVINSFLGSIRGEVPEENDMKSFQDDVLTVDFDKVQAIGDIMLINPRDIRRNQEPQVPDAVVPKQPETQPQEKQVQFDAERA
ncbi:MULTISPECIES: PRC-barrel domain-containing protein [Methanobrevibacter]|uniref:PRC-barrel domain-containing protein n=1 Tax=Methanobrevibacter TaxID=2172 RepID=UPI0015B7BCBC|nr:MULTISPECIES: PRC-barrel domain-containing protein [Methanobrevibacter]MBS7296039.1 PRC-barrel domain-containing protein [Treponema sp.]MCI7427907.1 PRC-barrel domain-containing protein [Methanobrevibacter sp.]MDD6775785.1 PRC-barrel domain-containing protein [Methanobacteriaceae archaeon]MDY3097414.1 PRC-barrel domain-containing protein [Methanobrevibacter sp.]